VAKIDEREELGTAGPRRRRADAAGPISRILIELRLSGKLTQRRAAEYMGISAVTLSRIEQGDLRVSAKNLERILNFYNLTISAAPRVESSAPADSTDHLVEEDGFSRW